MWLILVCHKQNPDQGFVVILATRQPLAYEHQTKHIDQHTITASTARFSAAPERTQNARQVSLPAQRASPSSFTKSFGSSNTEWVVA